MDPLPDCQYLGFIAHGRKWAEVLVTREGGRTRTAPTGVVYQTGRAAQIAVGAKNIAGAAVLR